MNPLSLSDVTAYVEAHIGDFHQKRLLSLEKIKLDQVLARKNPYLFRAKHMLTADVLVRAVLDAFLSSQEETLFGAFLEGVAVYVCQRVYGGIKPLTSDLEGIDLVFEKLGKLFIVEIKSGPNWGNSSQIKKMLLSFDQAKVRLQTQYPDLEIVAVNGCAYGNEPKFMQRSGAYLKVCGQDFWTLISGIDSLYLDIIEPLGYRAKERNEAFALEYAKRVNRFVREFIDGYCTADGAIDWDKLVKHVSERKKGVAPPFDS